MNKRKIMASLNNIANHLDNNSLYKEANSVTEIMFKLSHEKTAIKWPWQRNKEEELEKSQDDYVFGPDLEMSPPLSENEIYRQTSSDRVTTINEQTKKEITKYLSNVFNKLSQLVTESELREFLRQVRTWGGESQNYLAEKRVRQILERMRWYESGPPQTKEQVDDWIEKFGLYANLVLDEGEQQNTPGFEKFKSWVSEWNSLTMVDATLYKNMYEETPSMRMRSTKHIYPSYEERNLYGPDEQILEIFAELYSQFIKKIGPLDDPYRRPRQKTLPLDLPPSSFK